MNDEEKLLQGLFLPPVRKMLAVTGPDQGLHLVSLSHMMRTITMSVETGAHLPKACGMM